MIIQGRKTTDKDIKLVREMINANPSWNRTRLFKDIPVVELACY